MSKFIVLEGVGGSGKSTQIERLKQKYPDAVFVREPGATKAGEEIRELLFAQAGNLDPVAQLYLVHAARWQNVIENIAPALEAGKIVFCDRFQLSTFAYQVYLSGRDDVLEHLLETQAQFISVGINPHYIFLDIPPEESFKRLEGTRNGDTDSFDQYSMEYQSRIYQGYKQGIQEMGISYTLIDANQDFDAVSVDVDRAIQKELESDKDSEHFGMEGILDDNDED
ncbi:MAG: dTMP kinase [Patescibacteria group bacterium]